MVLLLLLLLRGIATIAGLLLRLLLIAVACGCLLLLRWIVGILTLQLRLWVACGEGVDLADELLLALTKRAGRLEIR